MLALGTRGDVQPVALLAWQLAQTLNLNSSTNPKPPGLSPGGPGDDYKTAVACVTVTLITHAAHAAWLQQLQVAFVDAAAGRHLQLLYVSSLPAAVWHQQGQGMGSSSSTTMEQQAPAMPGQQDTSTAPSQQVSLYVSVFQHSHGSWYDRCVGLCSSSWTIMHIEVAWGGGRGRGGGGSVHLERRLLRCARLAHPDRQGRTRRQQCWLALTPSLVVRHTRWQRTPASAKASLSAAAVAACCCCCCRM